VSAKRSSTAAMVVQGLFLSRMLPFCSRKVQCGRHDIGLFQGTERGGHGIGVHVFRALEDKSCQKARKAL
jgi:hypothetical protein